MLLILPLTQSVAGYNVNPHCAEQEHVAALIPVVACSSTLHLEPCLSVWWVSVGLPERQLCDR